MHRYSETMQVVLSAHMHTKQCVLTQMNTNSTIVLHVCAYWKEHQHHNDCQVSRWRVSQGPAGAVWLSPPPPYHSLQVADVNTVSGHVSTIKALLHAHHKIKHARKLKLINPVTASLKTLLTILNLTCTKQTFLREKWEHFADTWLIWHGSGSGLTDHLRDVRQQQTAKKVGGFPGNLSRHVVDGADEHTTASKA